MEGKRKRKVRESFRGLLWLQVEKYFYRQTLVGGRTSALCSGERGKKKKILSGKDATAQLFLGSDFFPGAGPAASSRMGEGGPHPSRAIMYTVAPKTNDWSRESGYATAVNSRNFRVTGLL